MTDSDPQLVRRFLDGDTEAFAELVRRHERRVYNLCLRMLGRPEDARDATQDALLTALRKLGGFRGDAAFSTWLHRVAVNACYDIQRRRARRPEEPLPEEPGAAAGDVADTAADVVDVQAALLRVQEEFRAVLILHDVQDLPYEEIAEIVGVPIGTVKSRLHRGRLAMAALLSGTSPRDDASEEKMEPS